MPWRVAPAVVNTYPGVNWIHPLKQHSVELLLEEVAKHPEIEWVAVFGSSVEERCTDLSDVDVLVKGIEGFKLLAPDIDEYDIIRFEDLPKDCLLIDEVRHDGVCVYSKCSKMKG